MATRVNPRVANPGQKFWGFLWLMSRHRAPASYFLLFAGWILLSGCTCPKGAGRPFELTGDSFAFANGLRWTYEFPEAGGVVTKRTDPPPDYSLRCFPMVRSAREFFYHAEFRSDLPKVNGDEYRKLVAKVVGRSSRCPSEDGERITIPGYKNLHEFSSENGAVLQSQCGGPFQSFFQRGNWRMVFPLTHAGLRRTAERFVTKIRSGQLPIAHVYRFPNTTLNHAVLLYAVTEEGRSIHFSAYDPNNPERPAALSFDRESNIFTFERSPYFGGGAVRVYEVYRGLLF